MSILSDVSVRPAKVTREPVAAIADTIDELVMRIDHMAIAVPDLAAAVQWYSKALGFKLIEQRSTRGERTGMISAVMASGTTLVVLVQGTEPESQVCRFVDKFGAGVQHVAFEVRDLTRAIAKLEDAGAAPETPIIRDDGIRQVFLRRDPGSGVRVELIERSGGNFTDASVRKLFLAFESGDLY